MTNCPIVREPCALEPGGIVSKVCIACPTLHQFLETTDLGLTLSMEYEEALRKKIAGRLAVEPDNLDIFTSALEARASHVKGNGTSPFLLRCYKMVIKDIVEVTR